MFKRPISSELVPHTAFDPASEIELAEEWKHTRIPSRQDVVGFFNVRRRKSALLGELLKLSGQIDGSVALDATGFRIRADRDLTQELLQTVTPRCTILLGEFGNAMLAAVAMDAKRSGVTCPDSLRAFIVAGRYEAEPENSEWHCDGPEYPSTMRYVAAPIGSATRFLEGDFTRADFGPEGTYYTAQTSNLGVQTYPGYQIIRFPPTTVHQAPEPSQTIDQGMRLFMSVTLDLSQNIP